MSGRSPIRNGQPTTYWTFRNAVSVTQICLTVAGIVGAGWLLAVDGNGKRLWDAYYDMSQQSSQWATETFPFPWQVMGDAGHDGEDREDTQLSWLVEEYCGDEAWSVFEGETGRFEIIVCENTDGDLTYAGWNEDLGGISVPAEEAGGSWIAENDTFRYVVGPDLLTVYDVEDPDVPVIEEEMLWSETY